ncbi:hypothetical protein CF326_g7942 [Tilletia indica]|nr:hypothetical protein CF326_g7942 [Tilletia indica]
MLIRLDDQNKAMQELTRRVSVLESNSSSTDSNSAYLPNVTVASTTSIPSATVPPLATPYLGQSAAPTAPSAPPSTSAASN